MYHLAFALDAVPDIFILMARLMLVMKKKKEDAGATEAKRPAVAATTPTQE